MANHFNLEVEVLGPIRALRNGTEIPVGGPVDRAVLGVLAIRAKERVSVDDLLAAVYGGLSRNEAKRALQTAVWRIRRALGDDREFLITDHGGYRLDLAPGASDVGALHMSLDSAASACRDGRPQDAIALLSKAVARWRGPAPELPAYLTDPLEVMVSDAIEGLTILLLEAARPADALGHLRRLLDVHPDHRRALELVEKASFQRGVLATSVEPPPGVPQAGDAAATSIDRALSLPEPAATILRFAAVFGQCSFSELQAAIGRWGQRADQVSMAMPSAPSTLIDGLAECEGQGLIATVGSPVDAIAIRPGLVDQVMANCQPSDVLAMHADAAGALRDIHGGGPGRHLGPMAEHLVRAVPVVPASEAIDGLAAAAEYELISDPTAACVRVERALELHTAWIPVDEERRLDLLLVLGRARDNAGDPDGADAAWEDVAEMATIHNRPEYLAYAALEVAGTMWKPRDNPRADLLLERAIGALSPTHRLRSLMVLRRVQLEIYRPDAPTSRTRVASDRLLLAGLPTSDAASRATLAMQRWLDDVEEGTGTLSDDPEVAALVAASTAAGDQPLLELNWMRWSISRSIFQGRFVEAERRLASLAARLPAITEAATTSLERDEFSQAPLLSAAQMAILRMYQGRGTDTLSMLGADLVDDDPAESWSRLGFDPRSVIALFHARSGDSAKASTMLSSVLAGLSELPNGRQRFSTILNASYVAADLGEPTAIRELLAEVEPMRGRHAVAFSGYSGVAEHGLGRLRAANGDLDEADALLSAADSEHVRVGADVFATLSRFWRVDVLQRLGGAARLTEAKELLNDIRRAHERYNDDAPAEVEETRSTIRLVSRS